MRILILSYSYNPALTPRAFRWTAMADWLAAQGHNVEVICSKSAGLADFQIMADVRVHRVGGSMRASLKNWLHRKPAITSAIPITVNTSPAMRSGLARAMKQVYALTLKKIMWPDFAGFWYFHALRKAKMLVENNSFDAIVSVSVPFTGHLVGLALQKKYGIRWLADIGDPFSFMTETPVNNHWLFHKLNYYSESKVLERASVISVTTEGTKTEYCKHFPHVASGKISVIPPLFAIAEQPVAPQPFFKSNTKIRLVFAGTLYSRIRNPAALLNFFKSMLDEPIGERLELHFFGAINDCEFCFEKFSSLIGTKIFLHGLVAREEALRAMKEATILVNLGNGTAYQLPSKVVEYVMLAKPVLNISPIELDSSQDLFSGFNSIFSVSESSLSCDLDIYADAKSFIENPPAIDLPSIAKFSEMHSINRIGKSYIDLLSA